MTHCPIWKVKKAPLKGDVKGVKTKPFTKTREHVFKQTIYCFNCTLFEKIIKEKKSSASKIYEEPSNVTKTQSQNSDLSFV